MPQFSVIVPSRGDEAKLLSLLDALARQTLDAARLELIVVLDGVAPPLAVAERAGALGAHLEALERRAGPGAARNRGARLARGDYLAFTEDDCVPAPDWLGRAAARLAVDPGIDVLEGFTRKPDGRPARAQFGEAPLYLPTNLFVRRARFERAGGYCEAFFDPGDGVYFREDSDLGFTLEESGARVVIEPDVVVTHPEEHLRYLDPLRWARRYRMDPLLEARHPRLYRERIEAHRLGPFVVRRPIPRACAAYVLSLAAAAMAWLLDAPYVAAALLALAGLAFLPVWAKWRFDLLRLPVCLLVPVVMVGAMLRGTAAARGRGSKRRKALTK